MKIWPFNKIREVTTIPIDYKPSMYANASIVQKLTEQFKGEIEQKKIRFPQELGEEHPFDFKFMEELYKKFGFYTAIIDKYVDYIWGPGFFIKCDDDRAKEIINDFIEEVDLATIGRQWTREGLNKGSGFIEIGGSKEKGVEGLKKLNANWIYVNRDKKGKVEGYNQYKGGFDKFAKEKVIPLDKDNVAHFAFNTVGDCAYGLGLGMPAMKLIDDWLLMQKSQHQLMDRKANSPLHAQFGLIQGDTKILPKSEDIAAFGKDLEAMSNKTNWTTGPDVNFKVVDFGRVGEKFEAILQNDLDMLFYAFQVPPVVMGKANVPEGLAKVQMDAFQRRIQSIQAELEKVIEQKIFKRVLNANGLDVHVEFEWGTPSIMETEERLMIMKELVSSPMTSETLKTLAEEELVNLLKFNKDEYEKMKLEEQKKLEEERKRLETQPQPQVPGQNKNFPQKVQPKKEQPKQPNPKEILMDFMKIFNEKEKERIEKDNIIKKQLVEDIEKTRKDEIDKILNKIDEENKRKDELLRKTQEEMKKKDEERKIKKKIKKRISLMKRLSNKTSLLPAFRISRKLESVNINEYVKKVGNEWCVFSHQTGKNFGCYSTKAQAEKRLSQIKGFGESVKTEEPKSILKREVKNYENEKECLHCIEMWDDINDIKEWLGFSYKKYLGEILSVLGLYSFEQLKAVNEIELEAGYLSETQVNKLKEVLRDGFKEGKGIREMAKEVKTKVKIKDLYRMNEDGTIKKGVSGLPILSRSADKRPIGIVRTEVTRLANLGAEKYYKDNGITHEKWVASYGDRTCSDCLALDGTIYKIGEARPEIPLHPMCRCSLAPVVDLKAKGEIKLKEKRK
jgi:SPP1 gp7 family putative phage head morphogenesis protein